jgi:hypothetical protein
VKGPTRGEMSKGIKWSKCKAYKRPIFKKKGKKKTRKKEDKQ